MKIANLSVCVILIFFAFASVVCAVNDSTSVASVTNVDPTASYASSGVYGQCMEKGDGTYAHSCTANSPAYCTRTSVGVYSYGSLCECLTGFTRIVGGSIGCDCAARCMSSCVSYTCYKN